MPAISIPCPACNATLKLPDTSLLGKKAKCPKCSHRFILALSEPDEVPLQLADVPVLPLAPRVGTSARWVPDEIPPAAPASAQIPAAPIASQPAQIAPVSKSSEVPETPTPDLFAFTQPSATPAPDLDFALPTAVAPVKTIAKATRPVRRSRRQSKSGMIVMAVTAIVVLGGGATAYFLKNRAESSSVAKPAPAVNPAWEAKKVELAASNESATALSPTSGKNIPLDYIPFTPHVLCHLRPMEICKTKGKMGEFQAMLGDLGLWLKDQIKLRTRFDAEDIAELTFAINFGPRMSAPEVAVVVRLREPQTETELIKRFQGRLRPNADTEVYESSDYSFLRIDNQTFAAAPLSLSDELAQSRNDAALASPDMEPLLRQSDRQRHVTLLFDLKILDSHREDIFLTQLQKVVDKFVVWMGSEIETVSWSMHLEPNLFMETLLHNTSDSSVMKVQRHAQLQLSRMAEEMLWGVKKMRPSTVGARQMIGRFPAMLQALDVGTTTHVAPSCARLVTVMPQKAAANLAAGALLTWNQSLLTNFDEDSSLTMAADMKVPDTVVERLQMKVLVDFRNTPLQEAFAYIGESIKTEVSIDGKALQGAGFTQVMSQTYNLGTVTAQEALHTILKKYAAERDPLVLIVDETNKKLMLSTKVKAATDGLTVFDTTPR